MCSFISLQVLGLAPTGYAVWMTIIEFGACNVMAQLVWHRFKLYHRSGCDRFKLKNKKIMAQLVFDSNLQRCMPQYSYPWWNWNEYVWDQT